MSHDKVIIQANANFHHASGEDLFEKQEALFSEYRRKWKEYPETFYGVKFNSIGIVK